MKKLLLLIPVILILGGCASENSCGRNPETDTVFCGNGETYKRCSEKEETISILKEQKDCEAKGGSFNLTDNRIFTDDGKLYALGDNKNRFTITCTKSPEVLFNYEIK